MPKKNKIKMGYQNIVYSSLSVYFELTSSFSYITFCIFSITNNNNLSSIDDVKELL